MVIFRIVQRENGCLMPERRFPPPWSIEELEACFVVNQRMDDLLG
jgi:hypothetical protein